MPVQRQPPSGPVDGYTVPGGNATGDVPVWDDALEDYVPQPGADAVSSVFGRTGDVVAEAGDYGSDKITNESGVSGATVSDALDALAASLLAAAAVEEAGDSTNSGAMQTALSLVTGALSAGNYVLLASCENTTTSVNVASEARIDGIVVLQQELQYAVSPLNIMSGIWFGALTAGSHTIDIRFRNASGGANIATCSMKRLVLLGPF